MSDNFWDEAPDEGHETPAMRVLREKAEADSKTIREMAERLAKMEERENATRLDGLIKAQGLDPKVKDLIPKDADPEKFLADYGSLLVRQAEDSANAEDEGDGSEGDGVPDDEAEARAAVAGAASGGQPKAGMDAVKAKLQPGAFESAEDLLAFLATQ